MEYNEVTRAVDLSRRDAFQVCSRLVDLLDKRDIAEIGDLLRDIRAGNGLPAASLVVRMPRQWGHLIRLPAQPEDAHFGWTTLFVHDLQVT